MQPAPVNSFFRFFAGFLGLISLAFIITYAVNSITLSQEHAQQAAAAHAVLMGQK